MVNPWTPLCVLLVGIGGCTFSSPGPITIDLNHTGPSAVLYDDGNVLRVTGCSDGALLGCNPPALGVTMTATIGGATVDVPQSDAGQIPDQMLGLLRDGPFQLSAISPADRQVDLVLAGNYVNTANVALLPGFIVETPPVVSRANGPITISHEMLAGTVLVTDGLLISTCGTARRTDLVEATTGGQLVIAFSPGFSAADGPCTHELHVDQTVQVVTIADASLRVDVVRIEVVTFASEP